MSNRFLTARQVADLLQLSVETVYDLIARDGLPATKLGGSWRFDESELCAWFRTHRPTNSRPGNGNSET